jgi:cytoskeletal protein CcmA (bactofilin family)
MQKTGRVSRRRAPRRATINAMSDTPHRRITDKSNGPPTVIGAGVSFRGDIIAPGAVMLSGNVHGDGDVGGMLSIARGAHWEGQVRARSAVIAGKLIGSILVEDRLEVGAAAVIKGQVSAKSLAIARGAVIEGDIMVTSGEPIVQFVEKRADVA